MANKESGEDILRAILEKGSDKAKKAAADALTQQPPEVEVQKIKKRSRGLKKAIVAKIGNSKYYHDLLTGAIVDEQGQLAPKRIAEQLVQDKVSTTAKIPPRKAQSIPELSKLKKEVAELRKLNSKLIKTNKQMISGTSVAFELLQNALNLSSKRNSELLDAMNQQNFNFQEKVIELITGVKSPTRSSGETKTNAPTSRPKKGKASRFKKTQSKYQRRVAGMTAAQKKAHSDRIQSRAEQIAAIRVKANVGTVVKSGIVGAAGGVIAGGAIAALLGARKEPPKVDLDALNARTLGPTGGNIPTQQGQTREEQEAAQPPPPAVVQQPPAGTPTQQVPSARPVPTEPPAAPTRMPTAPPGTPTRQGGAANISEISQYIVSKAVEMGVDPNLALGIAAGEGLNRNTIGNPTFGNRDAKGYSFGPYQLYSASPDPTKIAPGGMAMEFLQKYKEPPNASNWRKQVDFSLEIMKRRGPAGLERGPWYAVRDRGGVANITTQGTHFARRQGITPGAIAPEANAPGGAGGLGAPTGGAVGSAPSAAAPTGTPEKPTAVSAAAAANQAAGALGTPNAVGGGNVREAQSGIRRLPLSPELRNVLQSAARAAGVDVTVTSGGQPAFPRGPRTGSKRHDLGNAADLDLYIGKRILSDSNPADIAIKKKFVDAAAAGGASGIGAGYMGPTKIHVGFGTRALWGGASWLRGTNPGSPNVQYASAPTTAVQGAQMANESAERAIAQGTAPTGGRMIVMNNTRTINNTRIINQSDSLPRGNRRNEGFNPLQVFAGALIGKAISRAF